MEEEGDGGARDPACGRGVQPAHLAWDVEAATAAGGAGEGGGQRQGSGGCWVRNDVGRQAGRGECRRGGRGGVTHPRICATFSMPRTPPPCPPFSSRAIATVWRNPCEANGSGITAELRGNRRAAAVAASRIRPPHEPRAHRDRRLRRHNSSPICCRGAKSACPGLAGALCACNCLVPTDGAVIAAASLLFDGGSPPCTADALCDSAMFTRADCCIAGLCRLARPARLSQPSFVPLVAAQGRGPPALGCRVRHNSQRQLAQSGRISALESQQHAVSSLPHRPF